MRKRLMEWHTGLGGGHLECDGERHFWVVVNHEKYNCKPETDVGPCHCTTIIEGADPNKLLIVERQQRTARGQ